MDIETTAARAQALGRGRYFALLVVYGLLFLAFFRLGGFFGLAPGGSLWYPAAGMRLALFLIYGVRLIPGVAVVELAAVALYGALVEGSRYSDWTEVLQVATSPVVYGLGTFIVTRYVDLDIRLRRLRDVVLLTVVGVAVPFATAATSRFIQILLHNIDPADFIASTIGFTIGDTVGVLMLTPLILVGYGYRREAARPPSAPAVETYALPSPAWGLLLRDFAGVWLFLVGLHLLPVWVDGLANYVHWYLAFLPIIWISFRHGLPGSITGVLAITGGAAWLLYLPAESVRFHEMQILIMFLAITALLMGSVVSSQQAAEEELRQRYGELQEIRARLEVGNQALADKNEELERFVYTVSHDLKSPLITIRGFLGYLTRDLEAGEEERLRYDIARIQDAAGAMGRLLDELLELSRIGRVKEPPVSVPLAELAHEAVNHVAGRISERGVRVEIVPDLPILHVDRTRLVQVLQNLIDNAVKYIGDQPEPRVEVGWRRDAAEPVYFVRDNGIGIERQHHERVFGLFEQLDKKREGTGLGLALVRRIIEDHQGKVWVESEGAGKGSTFCFTLGGQQVATT